MDPSEGQEERYHVGVPQIGSQSLHQLQEDKDSLQSFSFSRGGADTHLPLRLFSPEVTVIDPSNNFRPKYTHSLPVSPLTFQSVALPPSVTADYWPVTGVMTHPLGIYPVSWGHGYPRLLHSLGVEDGLQSKMSSASYKEEEAFEKASSAFDGLSEKEGVKCTLRTSAGDLEGGRAKGRLVANQLSNSGGRAMGRQVASQLPILQEDRSTGCLLEHQASDLEGSRSTGSLFASRLVGQRKKRNMKILPPTVREGTASVGSEEVSETSEEEMKGNEEWKSDESSGSDSVNEELMIDVSMSTSKPPLSSSVAQKAQCDQSSIAGMTMPRKRRRIGDENEVRRPLDLGWGRQVRLKHQPNGVCKSEVFYVAPCGKKLRTYPDVSRYLQRIGNTDLMLSDFSFSAKVFLGEFYEFNDGEYEKLSDNELERRRQANKDARKERESKLTSKRKKQVNNEEENGRLTKQRQKSRWGNGSEEDEMSQKAAKNRRKQVTEEEKVKRKQEVTVQKLEDANRKAREKELKKQQMAIERETKRQQQLQEKERQRAESASMKAQEREFRRQQAMALKAEEAHRKALVREKVRAERETEKQRLKEQKSGRKRLTAVMTNVNDSPQPCDDVLLHHPRPLPAITPIDREVSAVSFSDILMVVEFVRTFHEAFDLQEVPTVGSLQAGLVNRLPYRNSLIEFCLQMLDIIIHDSSCGIHHIVTPMGTLLSSVDITDRTFSEILRIMLEAKSCKSLSDAVSLLSRHSFLSLTADHKSAILAFLVNELLTSRVVLRIMDYRQERMAELRRCKWKIQCKIRKIRQAMNERYPTESSPDGKHPVRKGKVVVTNDGEEDEEDEEDGSDDEADVGDDSEGLSDVDMNDVEETTLPELKHELEGELTKLQKWQHLYRRKLHAAMRSMRSMSFGVDRYSRRYWALSHCGGMFVEGIDCEEMEHGLWWLQSRAMKVSEAELLKETKVESIPSLIKLPAQLQAEKHGQDNYHSRRNHRLQQVRYYRYQRSTTSTSKGGSSKTNISEDGSENEGSSQMERKLLSPYGRMSSYNPFQCDVTWLHCEMQKNPSVVRPVAVQPTLPSGAGSPRVETFDYTTTQNDESDIGDTGSHELSLLAAVATSQRECEQRTQRQRDNIVQMENVKDMTRSAGLITDPMLTLASETLKVVKAAEKAKTQNHKTRKIVSQLPSALCSVDLEGCNSDAASAICEQREPLSVSKDVDHGWWVIKEADEMRSVFKALCSKGFRENDLRKMLCRNLEYACRSCGKGVKDIMIPDDSCHSEGDSPRAMVIDDIPGNEDGVDYPQETLSASLVLLNDIEDLEDRLLSASLQSKGWKPRSLDEDVLDSTVDDHQNPNDCLRNASDRLLALEEAVERRYLKPPLRDTKPLTSFALNACLLDCGHEQESADCDDRETVPVPQGLSRWRSAVRSALSAAQLTLCCNQLKKCIAWEKSIMKVFCQVCLKGDNEALLLLCDGCEKGVHTYCCKPKLSGIPDGDWYCHLCVQNAAGDNKCTVCSASSTTGRMINCGHCPRQYHMRCLDPPMSRPPKELWCCPVCKKQMDSSRASAEQLKLDVDDLIQQANNRPSKRSRGRDMAACRALLRDLEKQPESWPFLMPVAKKQVPSYYQIIKRPMDFQTIRNRMKENQYLSREAFAADVRLIFTNCRTFNEDDSEVGKSGIVLSRYFEKRWKDVNHGALV